MFVVALVRVSAPLVLRLPPCMVRAPFVAVTCAAADPAPALLMVAPLKVAFVVAASRRSPPTPPAHGELGTPTSRKDPPLPPCASIRAVAVIAFAVMLTLPPAAPVHWLQTAPDVTAVPLRPPSRMLPLIVAACATVRVRSGAGSHWQVVNV